MKSRRQARKEAVVGDWCVEQYEANLRKERLPGTRTQSAQPGRRSTTWQ